MKLKNKIVPKSDFQYSVNIDYDLNSEEKIKGYIPTIGGLNIIEDVMLSTVPNSKDRARLFVGAYGKGKSFFFSILLCHTAYSFPMYNFDYLILYRKISSLSIRRSDVYRMCTIHCFSLRASFSSSSSSRTASFRVFP